jgi:hypothetical protein
MVRECVKAAVLCGHYHTCAYIQCAGSNFDAGHAATEEVRGVA